MKGHNFYPVLSAFLVLTLASLACYFGQPPSPTSPPTQPPTKEEAPPPTEAQGTEPTAESSAQVPAEFDNLLTEWKDKGYITTTEGDVYTLDPFKEESSDPAYYQWWPYDLIVSDVLFKGHLKWSTAAPTTELSGCGIIFGLQDNDNHYGVFLDKSRIAFFMKRGTNTYEIGKTRGSGRLNFGNPAEADLVMSVKGKKAYVSVNGDVTEYTLSEDQSTEGNFALTLWTGTSSGYGTRCEMTDMYLFIPK